MTWVLYVWCLFNTLLIATSLYFNGQAFKLISKLANLMLQR